MRTKPPTITVQLTPEDFDVIHKSAHRFGASVSQLMKLGTLRLITQIERGEYIPEVLPEYQPGEAGRIGNA